jgi:iron(III) transport system substrate-binding protein
VEIIPEQRSHPLPTALAGVSRVTNIACALVAALMVAALAGCGAQSPSPVGDGPTGTIHLYTSVTQDTVDAVLAVFADAYPSVTVDVFRAPTGELDARIASERRAGSIGADVLWGTDPLSVHSYAAGGLFRAWTPAEAAAVPAAYRTDTFWGTRILNMVIVAGADVEPMPADWTDLSDTAYAGAVAIPDPGFAGSAYGALGYFATSPVYGIDYYQELKANGAVQVQAIPEVLTDVAEGVYKVGMTLDKVARDAIAQGSPVRMVWPASGAIAIYSPIAVFADTRNVEAAEAFANLVLGIPAQEAIAGTGWQPIRADATGGPPIEGPQVAPDWERLFSQQDELMTAYRAIFGG